MNPINKTPKHLAWHETLEVHELVAFQSIGLIKLKMAYPKVDCPTLKGLYKEAIEGLSANIYELLQFYPLAPTPERAESRNEDIPFYAGDLLGLFKTAVRYYAIGVTETATPALRDVLTKQLNAAIDIHAKAFNYMYEKSLYPSYDLNKMLQNDVNLAQNALSKPI